MADGKSGTSPADKNASRGNKIVEESDWREHGNRKEELNQYPEDHQEGQFGEFDPVVGARAQDEQAYRQDAGKGSRQDDGKEADLKGSKK